MRTYAAMVAASSDGCSANRDEVLGVLLEEMKPVALFPGCVWRRTGKPFIVLPCGACNRPMPAGTRVSCRSPYVPRPHERDLGGLVGAHALTEHCPDRTAPFMTMEPIGSGKPNSGALLSPAGRHWVPSQHRSQRAPSQMRGSGSMSVMRRDFDPGRQNRNTADDL